TCEDSSRAVGATLLVAQLAHRISGPPKIGTWAATRSAPIGANLEIFALSQPLRKMQHRIDRLHSKQPGLQWPVKGHTRCAAHRCAITRPPRQPAPRRS